MAQKIYDFEKGADLEGVPVEDFESEVLDHVIVVKDYEELDSQYDTGSFFIVQYEEDGETKTFSTGGMVLKKQISKLKETGKLPCRCKIIRPKGKRYYTLTAPK